VERLEEHQACGSWHGFGISGNMNRLYMELVQNKTSLARSSLMADTILLRSSFMADTFEMAYSGETISQYSSNCFAPAAFPVTQKYVE
jgi:hypothetical protein